MRNQRWEHLWFDPHGRKTLKLGKSKSNSRQHPMTLTAVLTSATEGGFVALNPETGTTTQGETIDEALANLQEATELYLEEFPANHSCGNAWVTTFEVPSAATATN